jgi:hypothetical protein
MASLTLSSLNTSSEGLIAAHREAIFSLISEARLLSCACGVSLTALPEG